MTRTTSLKIGSISWIHQQLTPVKFITDGKLLEPNWIPQTYIGLYATRNRSPSAGADLPAYEASKEFRAMTFAELLVETSDDGKNVLDVKLTRSILNPGWTPPFDRTITLITQIYVPEPSMKDPNYHAGELGDASSILLQKRHPNSVLGPTVAGSSIVASALILFRAGSITDDIGVTVVKCPFHVPWVWCEWLLTYQAGKFSVAGTGSVFPTHTFYAQGAQYGQQDEPTDARFVRSWRHPLTIDTSTLRVYPVLTIGAPATGPQAPDASRAFAGAIASLPYAVGGSGFASSTTI